MSTQVGSVLVSIGDEEFLAMWERDLAPETCVAFEALLPYTQRVIHVRWSGEACWIPLGLFDLGVALESPTSHPAPGQLLFYPGGISETEILLPYGQSRFSCVAGELEGSPFLTITQGLDRLARVGKDILWNGSREISFRSL